MRETVDIGITVNLSGPTEHCDVIRAQIGPEIDAMIARLRDAVAAHVAGCDVSMRRVDEVRETEVTGG